MIDVNNETDVEIEEIEFAQLARFVLGEMHIAEGAELGILFVDEQAMEQLHIQWMDEPGPTDVLSFPMDELRPGTADRPRRRGCSATSSCVPRWPRASGEGRSQRPRGDAAAHHPRPVALARLRPRGARRREGNVRPPAPAVVDLPRAALVDANAVWWLAFAGITRDRDGRRHARCGRGLRAVAPRPMSARLPKRRVPTAVPPRPPSSPSSPEHTTNAASVVYATTEPIGMVCLTVLAWSLGSSLEWEWWAVALGGGRCRGGNLAHVDPRVAASSGACVPRADSASARPDRWRARHADHALDVRGAGAPEARAFGGGRPRGPGPGCA